MMNRLQYDNAVILKGESESSFVVLGIDDAALNSADDDLI